MVLKKGLELLSEQPGEGSPVRKHAFYESHSDCGCTAATQSGGTSPGGFSTTAPDSKKTARFSSPTCESTGSFCSPACLRNSGNECRRNTAAADCSTPGVRRAGFPRNHSAECHPYGGAFSHRRATRRPVAMSECRGRILGIGSIWRPSGPQPLPTSFNLSGLRPRQT